jgi:DNA-binding NarL/FixJ family response regulator
MRIAIGDDHAIIRDALKVFVRELGDDVEVMEAESYAAVLDLVRRCPDLALLVLDLCMPDMEPMAGLAAVRASYPGRIAVFSAMSEPKTISAALTAGADGYIPKRLGHEAMVSALRLILAGETFVPSLAWPRDDPWPFRSAAVRSGLTRREGEVLDLVREGLSNKAIARRLNLSEVTVKSHIGSIFRKLGVHNRVQAARAAAAAPMPA